MVATVDETLLRFSYMADKSRLDNSVWRLADNTTANRFVNRSRIELVRVVTG